MSAQALRKGNKMDKSEVKNEIEGRVEALSAFEQDILKVIIEEYTSDINEALQIVEYGDYTTWSGNSMADVAKTMAEECGYLDSVPDKMRYYIDYEKWGRDLDLEGTFLEGNGFFVEIF